LALCAKARTGGKVYKYLIQSAFDTFLTCRVLFTGLGTIEISSTINPMAIIIFIMQQSLDSLRIKAVTFLGRLTRLKKKTIVKHKLYITMIQVIFSIMAQQELPDDEDEDEDDDDSSALAASQSLDILALNLAHEKYITTLLSQVQPALASPWP
jgi:hypothetical protein